ncbi:Uncharacterised protein [uncultured archaeon]|nr:Uncharacterised protein [uncultured archaeon]
MGDEDWKPDHTQNHLPHLRSGPNRDKLDYRKPHLRSPGNTANSEPAPQTGKNHDDNHNHHYYNTQSTTANHNNTTPNPTHKRNSRVPPTNRPNSE